MNRPPMMLSRVAKYMKNKDGRIAVVVGTVTDDPRLMNCPKLQVCALRFTETARCRIVKNGGDCLTFDQLAMTSPKGRNTILLRGRRNAREAHHYFGTPGTPGSKTRPRTKGKSRKVERARGRRKSRGFKV